MTSKDLLSKTSFSSSPLSRGLALWLLMSLSVSCAEKPESSQAPVYGYEVVKVYAHRPTAFTQGLVMDEGFLYEGTGTYGDSTLCKIELETGRVLQCAHLPDHMWGEGITIFGDRLYQLTWRSRTGFVYDKSSFKLLRKFNYAGEGWGITHNGNELIMSDGSATLTFLDPNTLEPTRKLNVTDANLPVTHLNELEYFEGRLYANVWLTNDIVVIDPNSGALTARIRLDELKAREARADVLNGIAYDAIQRRLLVTGKYWSRLYEIKTRPK